MKRLLVVAVVLGTLAAAGALAASGPQSVVPYRDNSQTMYGVRPSALGLPQIGERGTVGADALAGPLRAYHDSGAYARDLTAVDRAAQAYIAQRLRPPPAKRCSISYRHVRGTLYRRIRTCVMVTAIHTGPPALVLDIDETSLSNYADLSLHNFSASALAISAALAHGTAIAPTLTLYKWAVAHKVAVFFVTGRPPQIDAITKANLRSAGYTKGWSGLYEKPVSAGTEAFKSATRAALEKRGYDIVANVGDQASDLDGGHADRAFKLPDPFYFISD